VGVCVSAAVVAGCGEEPDTSACAGKQLTKGEYEDCFKGYVSELEKQGQDFDPPKDATSTEQADALDRGLLLIHGFARDLEEMKPPADVASANRDFAAGLHRTADELEPAVPRLRADDEAGAAAILDRFPSRETREKVISARRRLSEKGYDLGDVTDLVPLER
jgi:hypothetical protein